MQVKTTRKRNKHVRPAKHVYMENNEKAQVFSSFGEQTYGVQQHYCSCGIA